MSSGRKMMLPFLMWQVRIKAMLIGVDSAIYSISLLSMVTVRSIGWRWRTLIMGWWMTEIKKLDGGGKFEFELAFSLSSMWNQRNFLVICAAVLVRK